MSPIQQIPWSGIIARSVAAVLAVAFSVGCVTPPPQVIRPLKRDLDAHVNTYLEQYMLWVEEDPTDPQRHATLGVVYEANELWSEARACFHIVVDLLPSEVLARYHEAVACQELGEVETAIELLQRITGDHPDFAPAHHRLGRLLLAAGDLDGAFSAFQRTVELAPDRVEGHLGLADVMLRRRNAGKAEVHARRALDLDRHQRMAWFLLGQSLRGRPGHEVEALRALRTGTGAAVTFLPDPWSAAWPIHAKGLADQMRLAHNLATAGRENEAVKVLEVALGQRPGNTDVLNNLAVILRRSGRPAPALAYLEQALAVKPESFATHINISACLLDLGRFDAALEAADRAILLFESNAQAHVTKARILLAQGHPDKAVVSALLATELASEDPLVHLTLADVQFQLRRFEDSLLACNVSLDLASLEIEPLLCKSRALIALGRPREAAAVLKEARAIQPGDVRLHELEQRLASIEGLR